MLCRPVADLGMDAFQGGDEFAEPPLVSVQHKLFVLGVNWDVTRFSTRTGTGGRRRYILARLDPETLRTIEQISGDAPHLRFGPSKIGLIGGDDQLFLLAGEVWLVSDGLQLKRITSDLENTAGPVAVARAGDLLAISGLLAIEQLPHPKVWVLNLRTQTTVFSHEFRGDERVVALAVDPANQALAVSTQTGVFELSYIDESARQLMSGAVDGWGFHCGPYLVLPHATHSAGAGYAILDSGRNKARYWAPSGAGYGAATCAAGQSLVAITYQPKPQRNDKAAESSVCLECQVAYDPSRLPSRTQTDTTPSRSAKPVRARVVTYDLVSGNGSQTSAELPQEVPLASAWDSRRNKLFVMTAGHVCAVSGLSPPRASR